MGSSIGRPRFPYKSPYCEPKKPLSSDVVEKSAINTNGTSPLADLPFLVSLLLGFSPPGGTPFLTDPGHPHLYHMSANIPKRKHDQYCEEHTIMTAKSGKSTCPVTTTSRILNYLESSSPFCPVITRIIKSKSKEYLHRSLGISVTRTREDFKSYMLGHG